MTQTSRVGNPNLGVASFRVLVLGVAMYEKNIARVQPGGDN
jgi:hypothetical protein